MREGIKEAIEFLDHMANSFNCISSLNYKSINNKKNDIVALLEQGEALKAEKQEIKNELIKWWNKLMEEEKTSESVAEENYIDGELDMINMILSKFFDTEIWKIAKEAKQDEADNR